VAGSYPVSGLIHVSELSWDPVRNPRDLLEEGQMVRVKVIQVDLDRMRLALSMKQLQADPLLETLDTLMPVEAQVYYPVNYFTSPCTEGRIYCGMHCYLISSSCSFDLIEIQPVGDNLEMHFE
jgi:ribosomal protein S1